MDIFTTCAQETFEVVGLVCSIRPDSCRTLSFGEQLLCLEPKISKQETLVVVGGVVLKTSRARWTLKRKGKQINEYILKFLLLCLDLNFSPQFRLNIKGL